MKKYTTDEILKASGARPEELAELKADGLLVPHRPWRLLQAREEYYTADQLEVLKHFVSSRRIIEASRRRNFRTPTKESPPDGAA
ncbi:MAG: hypothetical protein ACOX87_09760 [Chloroflexota bacterium]